MKKLLLLAGAFCALTSSKCESDNKDAAAGAPSKMVTVNGYSFKEASTMINRFLKDKTIRSFTTNIWYSKSVFNDMVTHLNELRSTDIPIDGIRFYFAKNEHSENAVILVATYADDESRGNGSEPPHRDFFGLTAAYLQDVEAKGHVDQKPVAGSIFCDTSTPCEDQSTTGCDGSRVHYISCKTSRAMVEKFAHNRNAAADTINATSEWFDLGVLNDINKELIANPNSDGLRIYFAQRLKEDTKGINRDGFAIITTEKGKKDYHKCFAIHPIYDQKLTRDKDGYDNGQMCPTNCSIVTWPAP